MTDEQRQAIADALGLDSGFLIIAAVIFCTFFIGFGGGIIFPIIPNLGTLLGISPVVVGIILSANRFSRLLLSAPAGAMVDRMGTRSPFIAGMAIQTVATGGYIIALYAPAPEIWFLIARLGWGVGSALVFATAYTIASDVSDDTTRGASMGLIRGGILFGAPTGLVLGGIISEFAGIATAFMVATALAAIATALAHLLIPETHVQGPPNTSIKPWDVDTSLAALVAGATNFVLLFVYFGVVFSTMVLVLDARDLGVFGMDAQGSSGVFMGLTVVTAGVFTFIGGYLSDRFDSRMPTLLIFLGLTALGFLFFAQAYSLDSLVAACLLLGIGQGGTSGPLMALLGDLTAEERMGRAVGTTNVLGDVGGTLGPIISLPLVHVIGFGALYLLSALLPLVAALILLVGIHRRTGRFFPAIGDD